MTSQWPNLNKDGGKKDTHLLSPNNHPGIEQQAVPKKSQLWLKQKWAASLVAALTSSTSSQANQSTSHFQQWIPTISRNSHQQ